MANLHSNFQVRPRMRIMDVMIPYLHQPHVIKAITRHPEIDKEDLYGEAVAGLRHRNNAEAFAILSEVVHKVTSGTLLDDKSDAQVEPLFDIGLSNFDEDTCSAIRGFNHKYLNDKGDSALQTLLTFDASGLELTAIDIFRGGETLIATYGSRKTRRDKKLGKQMQDWLKDLKSSDEAATIEAANRYAEYRYLHDGNFSAYKKFRELKDEASIHRYYRDWFRKFNNALGFPSPRPGPSRNQVTHPTVIEMSRLQLLHKPECRLCKSIHHSFQCSKPPWMQADWHSVGSFSI